MTDWTNEHPWMTLLLILAALHTIRYVGACIATKRIPTPPSQD
jgi:hypothetical protein